MHQPHLYRSRPQAGPRPWRIRKVDRDRATPWGLYRYTRDGYVPFLRTMTQAEAMAMVEAASRLWADLAPTSRPSVRTLTRRH